MSKDPISGRGTEFGQALGRVTLPIPGPRSIELASRLRKTETPGVTYLSNDFPIFWHRAYQTNVEDVDGNRFVDLTAAFGVAALGHSHPAILQAIAEQARLLPHGMGDVHPPEIKVRLLERLANLFPEGGAQALLCNGGAEAVESALKTAYLATGNPGVLTFEGGYHGLTYGTLAASGTTRFREPFLRQLAPIRRTARFPHRMANPSAEIARSILEIETALDEASAGRTPIGAILVEPIQGRAGVIVPPEGWLSALGDVAKQRNVLLILDEVMTGFGRTGSLFAFQSEQVVPDLLCVGKALTGALPFSACIGRRSVMAAWPASTGEALHTSTFLGHPLGCAAALASIDEIVGANLSARAAELGRKAMETLREWENPLVTDIRGRGLMIGVELRRGDETGLAQEVVRRALPRGVILLPAGGNGNVISITPPLTISEELLLWALDETWQVIASI